MFSTILKELREEKNVTQLKMATDFGMSRNTIASWEAKKREPPIETLIKIANYFDVTLDYLCGRTADISLRTAGYQPAATLTPKERRLIDDFKVLKDYEQTQILSLTRTIAENRTVIEAKRGD